MSIKSQVAIIGSGPAAHTAAIYTGRANLAPHLFEGEMAGGIAAGGLLTTTTTIDNYPGLPGVRGLDLTDTLRRQSEECGATIVEKTVTRVDLSARPFKIWCEGEDGADDKPYLQAAALIVATGAAPRLLTCPGAKELWQHGVSTCAVCDGALPMFRNKVLVVVGGGDSACEEALYLTHHASKVLLVHRRDTLRASTAMSTRALAHPKIQPIWNAEIAEICGDGSVESVVLNITETKKDGKEGETKEETKEEETKVTQRTEEVAGVFVAIGHVPNTGFLDGQLGLDAEGFIETGHDLTTSVEGVWAAGDVQDRRYRQAITAAASGCMAALECERWLSHL